jgi:microcystin-dependent protein
VAHGGFLIPNAGTVTEPLLSEPVRIDFNTMAQGRWGVLQGCQVTGSGSNQIKVSPGSAMVNGKFVYVVDTDLFVSVPSGASKFDLICVDDSGKPFVHPGKESSDPYYPDPPVNATLLAAVYCKEGVSLADFVIDKRKFLAPALMTSIDQSADLIRNFKAPGATAGSPLQDWYRVYGDGRTVWGNDTTVSRSGVGSLQIDNNLTVTATLGAKTVSAEGISATADIAARNLRRATSPPTLPNKGDFWQNPDCGSAYIANDAPLGGLEWDEIATMGNMIPVGTVIMSLESVARMEAKGWLALNGRTALEDDYPGLFNIAALTSRVSGYAPHRQMALPDLTSRVVMPNFDANGVGKVGPVIAGVERKTNTYVLLEANIPEHHHGVNAAPTSVTPKGIIQATTGTHAHGLPDHSHKDVETPHHHNNGIATVNATVTPVVDGAAVGANAVLTPLYAGKEVSPSSSDLAMVQGAGLTSAQTIQGGPHGHPFEGTPQTHDHDMIQTTFGKRPPDAINFTPNFFTMYYYIRT